MAGSQVIDVASDTVTTLVPSLPEAAAADPGALADAALRDPRGITILSEGELAIASDGAVLVAR